MKITESARQPRQSSKPSFDNRNPLRGGGALRGFQSTLTSSMRGPHYYVMTRDKPRSSGIGSHANIGRLELGRKQNMVSAPGLSLTSAFCHLPFVSDLAPQSITPRRKGHGHDSLDNWSRHILHLRHCLFRLRDAEGAHRWRERECAFRRQHGAEGASYNSPSSAEELRASPPTGCTSS